jgi:hypothetical protein
MTYISLIGLESQQQARYSEQYVSESGLSRVRNVFQNYKRAVGIACFRVWKKANCLEAVDGKHIRVIKHERSGSIFYNHKDLFFRSINGRGTH